MSSSVRMAKEPPPFVYSVGTICFKSSSVNSDMKKAKIVTAS